MPNMTIKDIARLSGCSVSTISRVINDRPDVRPETKEKVLQMMRESGFVPNTNARQLKIQQSRSLVFVVKGTRNLFFSDFLVQLQRAATLYGYSGIVSYLDENANEIDAAEKILREIKPKGMIFLGGSVANFKKGFANITVPSVLTTLVSDELDFPNLSMVGVDDRAAAYTAVDYLIQQGHRKIAVLGGPVTSYPSVMRREGAQQAMQDAGILFSDKLYGLSNYDFESAYHAMNSLLARRAEFTALFAMSDVIAFGAIRALVSAGMRVPEDVSVIGFDGITMSRTVRSPGVVKKLALNLSYMEALTVKHPESRFWLEGLLPSRAFMQYTATSSQTDAIPVWHVLECLFRFMATLSVTINTDPTTSASMRTGRSSAETGTDSMNA